MKKEVILGLLALLILTPVCLADDSWLYNSEKLLIELNISSSMNIVPDSKDYSVDYVTARLSFFPEDDFQQRLTKLETSPDSLKKDSIIEFKWEQPDEKELYFLLKSEVETENTLKKITKKVGFPLKNLDEEYIEYTKPTENIDLNEDMIKIASGLAEGKDDLYVITHKIAEWVSQNIEYDIKYGTSTEKASWILKNKIGTCDEFSSLFIALCRSLGIPARYVSGVAYSNLPELEGFGNHAWADVYFPDYGWVPFDPTYGEFGFVNPSHIKLKTSADSGNTSTSYEWRGHSFDIVAEKLDISALLKKTEGIKSPLISIKADVLKNSIGFGSYNLIEITISNINSYYVPITLRLSAPIELDVIDNKKNILIKPKEIKKVYWIVKLTENLKRNYIYTLPITVYELSDISSTSSVESKFGDIILTKQEIDELLEAEAEENLKAYSREIDLKCNQDKEDYYIDENILVSCFIKNTGNIFLNNIKICLENDCKIISLGISQEKSINLSTNPKSLGKKQAAIKAMNDQVSKTSYLDYNILDYPNITITDLSYPAEVLFNKDYSVSFTLNKSSSSIPKNIDVTILQNSFPEKWPLRDLDKNKMFDISLNSKTLHEGENDFEVIVSYEDNKSRVYETKKNFSIIVVKLSFPQKALSLIYSLELWLESLF